MNLIYNARVFSLLLQICILFFFVLSFQDTIVGIVHRWLKFDEAYSHGLLVGIISFYLLTKTFFLHNSCKIRPDIKGFAGLIISLLVWYAASIMFIQVLEELVLPAIFWLMIWSLFGWRQAANSLVPIGILYFAIPIWDYLAWPLQILTVTVTQAILGMLGVHFTVEGVFVYLTNVGAFEVAHGCSGLRYLVVAMTLTALYGYLNYQRIRTRLLLFMVGVVFSLLANWIRVFIIIYAGYLTNMQSSLVENHDFFGWVVFAFSLIPVFLIAHCLERNTSIPASAQEENISDDIGSNFSIKGHLFSIGTVFFLVLSPHLVRFYVNSPTDINIKPDVRIESALADNWSPFYQQDDVSWRLDFKGVDHALDRLYYRKGQLTATGLPEKLLLLRIRTYDAQVPGKELVQYANRLYDKKILKMLSSADVNSNDQLAHLYLSEGTDSSEIHVLYGYYVSRRWVTDPLEAKVAQLNSLISGRRDASIVAVGFWCRSGCKLLPDDQAMAEKIVSIAIHALDSRNPANGT